MDNGRIMKELKELQEAQKNSKAQQVEAKMVNDNLRKWKGKIFGPKDTPYEGGTFIVDIEIP